MCLRIKGRRRRRLPCYLPIPYLFENANDNVNLYESYTRSFAVLYSQHLMSTLGILRPTYFTLFVLRIQVSAFLRYRSGQAEGVTAGHTDYLLMTAERHPAPELRPMINRTKNKLNHRSHKERESLTKFRK